MRNFTRLKNNNQCSRAALRPSGKKRFQGTITLRTQQTAIRSFKSAEQNGGKSGANGGTKGAAKTGQKNGGRVGRSLGALWAIKGWRNSGVPVHEKSSSEAKFLRPQPERKKRERKNTPTAANTYLFRSPVLRPPIEVSVLDLFSTACDPRYALMVQIPMFCRVRCQRRRNKGDGCHGKPGAFLPEMHLKPRTNPCRILPQAGPQETGGFDTRRKVLDGTTASSNLGAASLGPSGSGVDEGRGWDRRRRSL